MCRTTETAVLGLIVAAALGSTAPVAGQDSTNARIRAERLYERLEMTRARGALADSLQQIVTMDTVIVGNLTLVTLLEEQDRIREVVRELRSSYRAVFGNDSGPPTSITMSVVPFRRSVHLPGRAYWYRAYWYGDDTDVEGIAAGVLHQVRTELWEWLGDTMFHWLRNPPETDSLSLINAQVVYTELATVPWGVVRSCYLGDLEACESALGVRMTPDSLDQWYTGAELRQFVTPRSYLGRYRGLPEYDECISSASKEPCLQVLAVATWLGRPPLSGSARTSLVRVAFELGGDGAFGRLASSEGTPLERLSAAAGVRSDSLLAVWHDRILEARPTSTQLSRPSAWIAFLWAIVTVTLATKSTRWRAP